MAEDHVRLGLDHDAGRAQPLDGRVARRRRRGRAARWGRRGPAAAGCRRGRRTPGPVGRTSPSVPAPGGRRRTRRRAGEVLGPLRDLDERHLLSVGRLVAAGQIPTGPWPVSRSGPFANGRNPHVQSLIDPFPPPPRRRGRRGGRPGHRRRGQRPGGGHGSDHGNRTINVQLHGYQEDPLVLSTTASGRLRGSSRPGAQEINYTPRTEPRGSHRAVAHPPGRKAPAVESRLPLHEPRQRTGRHPGARGAGDDHRHLATG